MSDALIVLGNWGLGDAVSISGAIVYLSTQQRVVVPCNAKYFEDVESFYIEHPNVTVLPVEDIYRYDYDSRKWSNVLRCQWRRFEGVIDRYDIAWDAWYYEQLGVPLIERWNSCPIAKAVEHVEQISYPAGNTRLVHEDIDRGFILNLPSRPRLKTVYVVPGGRLLGWANAIQNALEIDIIDSCIWHVAESLDLSQGQIRRIHTYCRIHRPTWHRISTKYNWQYVDRREIEDYSSK